MKTIKIAVLAIMILASLASYAKPKKGAKAQKNAETTNIVTRLSCTVENDGTVKEADGTVIGKLNSDGNVVNADGQVIGKMGKTDAEKIQEVYFAD